MQQGNPYELPMTCSVLVDHSEIRVYTLGDRIYTHLDEFPGLLLVALSPERLRAFGDTVHAAADQAEMQAWAAHQNSVAAP
jgi:hypothetical protein